MADGPGQFIFRCKMKVVVAQKCGFCPGVKDAISTAERIVKSEKDVYSLGPIIHNKDVVERLANSGLRTVKTVDDIPCGTVLIRSHGAAPEEISKIKKKGLRIVDATCVLVKRLQQIAAQFHKDGYTVVIIGDKNHPEVKSVVGCARDAVVIGADADLDKLGDAGRLGIVCQTTQSPEYFGRMVGNIASKPFIELKAINTLCREAIKRQESAVELCRKVDIMFVLGGLESANTRKLAELCREYNAQTFHLQNWAEFDKRIVFGTNTAGVTAGASTPEWIIKEFVNNLEALDTNKA